MPQPVALEAFPITGTAPARCEAAEAVSSEPDETVAEPAPDPLPEPDSDPQAERRACLSRIADALALIAKDQAALGDRCIADASAAVGAAAESIMPRAAQAGLAVQVAETVESLVRQGRWPRLELRATREDAAEINDALRESGVTAVDVVPDDTLDPGSVRLDWQSGGAEIDVETIAAAALDHFRRALEPVRNTEHDR